jgi:arabinogalactan endo-1,4-beta-galactosidase
MMTPLRILLMTAGLLATAAHAAPARFDTGADLSFTNEMEDCGAKFRNAAGAPADPFELTRAAGGTVARIRIWNNPGWTKYSTYDDVLKSIRRAHAAGLKVLLDFHYSDDWADADKQIAPAAWAGLDTAAQARALHDFTRDVLDRLAGAKALPEWVQVGNEINSALLGGAKGQPIDWTRNAALINAGIGAVREAAKAHDAPIKVMLHIAQPENLIPWMDAATAAGVLDYDQIGLSYYSEWSKYAFSGLAKVIAAARARYGADVLVVETAYPFTLEAGDTSANVLGQHALVPGYAATPKDQKRYLVDLSHTVADAGGTGVIYWAPDWVSTACKTRWGTGSTWENAAWFDLSHHAALPAFQFMGEDYTPKMR